MSYGTIGVWLLAVGGLAILIEAVVFAVWSLRLARDGRALAVLIDTQRGLIQADVARLNETVEETRRLWAPYRRFLRWLRHPLVAALVASFWRRLSRRKQTPARP